MIILRNACFIQVRKIILSRQQTVTDNYYFEDYLFSVSLRQLQ